MRLITLTLLVVSALCAFSIILFFTPATHDEPQPVAAGETNVQQIRASDGSIEEWTYSRTELAAVEPVQVEPGAAPPPSGAASVLNEQALNAWNSGEIRASIGLFENAIAADPNDPAPHSNFGRRLTVMVAYEKALPLLLRSTELSPDDPQVWLDLLTLYEKTLQFQRANLARRQARELAGDQAFVRNNHGAWYLDGTSLP